MFNMSIKGIKTNRHTKIKKKKRIKNTEHTHTPKKKKKPTRKRKKHKLQKNGKMKIRQIETKMKENTHMYPNETNID